MFDNTKKQNTTNTIGNANERKDNKMSAFSFGTAKKTIEKKAATRSNGKKVLQSEKAEKGIGFQMNQNSCISRTNNNLLGKEKKNNKNNTKQEKIHSSVVTNKEQNVTIPKNVPCQYIKQNNTPHFEFSGNKSNDLFNCVLTAIHSWKNHYNLSIPDDVLMDQILTLFNQLKEINR